MKVYDHKPIKTDRNHPDYGNNKLHRDPEFRLRNLIFGPLLLLALLAIGTIAVAMFSTPR